MVGFDATVVSCQRLVWTDVGGQGGTWGLRGLREFYPEELVHINTENSGENSCASSRGRQKVTVQKGAKVSHS